jgi:transcriptional regulator with XRE-family HTH domain
MLRLRELREQSSILQKDLSAELKIGISTLSQYETNKREPDIQTILRIADYFNVSVDYLLGKTDEPKPNIVKYDPELLFSDNEFNLVKNFRKADLNIQEAAYDMLEKSAKKGIDGAKNEIPDKKRAQKAI